MSLTDELLYSIPDRFHINILFCVIIKSSHDCCKAFCKNSLFLASVKWIIE